MKSESGFVWGVWVRALVLAPSTRKRNTLNPQTRNPQPPISVFVSTAHLHLYYLDSWIDRRIDRQIDR